jgi:hypothetical protein
MDAIALTILNQQLASHLREVGASWGLGQGDGNFLHAAYTSTELQHRYPHTAYTQATLLVAANAAAQGGPPPAFDAGGWALTPTDYPQPPAVPTASLMFTYTMSKDKADAFKHQCHILRDQVATLFAKDVPILDAQGNKIDLVQLLISAQAKFSLTSETSMLTLISKIDSPPLADETLEQAWLARLKYKNMFAMAGPSPYAAPSHDFSSYRNSLMRVPAYQQAITKYQETTDPVARTADALFDYVSTYIRRNPLTTNTAALAATHPTPVSAPAMQAEIEALKKQLADAKAHSKGKTPRDNKKTSKTPDFCFYHGWCKHTTSACNASVEGLQKHSLAALTPAQLAAHNHGTFDGKKTGALRH